MPSCRNRSKFSLCSNRFVSFSSPSGRDKKVISLSCQPHAGHLSPSCLRGASVKAETATAPAAPATSYLSARGFADPSSGPFVPRQEKQIRQPSYIFPPRRLPDKAAPRRACQAPSRRRFLYARALSCPRVGFAGTVRRRPRGGGAGTVGVRATVALARERNVRARVHETPRKTRGHGRGAAGSRVRARAPPWHAGGIARRSRTGRRVGGVSAARGCVAVPPRARRWLLPSAVQGVVRGGR